MDEKRGNFLWFHSLLAVVVCVCRLSLPSSLPPPLLLVMGRTTFLFHYTSTSGPSLVIVEERETGKHFRRFKPGRKKARTLKSNLG